MVEEPYMILLGWKKRKAAQCFKNGSFTCQRELSCEELNLYELKRGICKDLNISRGPIHQSGVPLSLLQMPPRTRGWKRRKKDRTKKKKNCCLHNFKVRFLVLIMLPCKGLMKELLRQRLHLFQ